MWLRGARRLTARLCFRVLAALRPQGRAASACAWFRHTGLRPAPLSRSRVKAGTERDRPHPRASGVPLYATLPRSQSSSIVRVKRMWRP
ncbi:MAG: hypothetical protein QOF43_1610, partial [Gaiellaceae bacterium]|nr:hypothetical protein [Gaiellaceae bacterium]